MSAYPPLNPAFSSSLFKGGSDAFRLGANRPHTAEGNGTLAAGGQMSHELVVQAAEQQRRCAADAAQRWMEHNARIMKILIPGNQQPPNQTPTP
jgi:hypothetical protein